MAAKIQFRNIALGSLLALSTLLNGCNDLFKDPLTDKETGEPVTFLLMDRNFIKTKLAVQLQDLASQQALVNEGVEIIFSGNDAGNLINFQGYKHTTYNTSDGFVEIGYDPGIEINSQNPIELTVIARSPNYISAPQFISYTSEGIKNLEIKMFRKTQLKSASIGAFGEPFDMSYNGKLHSPDLLYTADFSDLPTGTDYQYMNLYSTQANGTLLCNNLKEKLIYSDYGAYIFSQSGGSNILPPALPTKNILLQGGDWVYSTILKSGLSKCTDPLTLHVESANGTAGTGVFEYQVTFSDGKISTGKITCTFPSDNLIEQLYYPTSNPAVKIALKGDDQYNISAAVSLNSPCGSKASFIATPKSNLKAYKLITRYSCPESSVGMGLTIMGELRKKDSTGAWTSFSFIEGVTELQLEGGSDYDFRVSLDGKYYNYTIPTDPVGVKYYLENSGSVDFIFRNLVIVDNGSSVSISMDIEFSDDVCDIIQ